jgi:steroid 5-alpha reductase family enzyme
MTGIPPTEERLLRSKGDAYRTYQREVSAFFPRPPKKGVA